MQYFSRCGFGRFGNSRDVMGQRVVKWEGNRINSNCASNPPTALPRIVNWAGHGKLGGEP